MTWIVVLFGIAILGMGMYGLVQPAGMIDFVKSVWKSPAALPFAVGIRVVLGVALLVAAPDCRHPDAARVLGVIALVAAAGGLVMGRAGLAAFVGWFVDRPAEFVRAWTVFAIAFGGFLVYTAY
jgi:hypothetical protein